uniref:Uncharacterized protein n=1 Tax=Anopheles atroparvus TaxID=41427 RepID=A0A182J7K0_ANOAO
MLEFFRLLTASSDFGVGGGLPAAVVGAGAWCFGLAVRGLIFGFLGLSGGFGCVMGGFSPDTAAAAVVAPAVALATLLATSLPGGPPVAPFARPPRRFAFASKIFIVCLTTSGGGRSSASMNEVSRFGFGSPFSRPLMIFSSIVTQSLTSNGKSVPPPPRVAPFIIAVAVGGGAPDTGPELDIPLLSSAAVVVVVDATTPLFVAVVAACTLISSMIILRVILLLLCLLLLLLLLLVLLLLLLIKMMMMVLMTTALTTDRLFALTQILTFLVQQVVEAGRAAHAVQRGTLLRDGLAQGQAEIATAQPTTSTTTAATTDASTTTHIHHCPVEHRTLFVDDDNLLRGRGSDHLPGYTAVPLLLLLLLLTD